MEIMLRADYNLFGDFGSIPAGILAVFLYRLMRSFCVWIANFVGLWEIKHKKTAWHSIPGSKETDEEFAVPNWEELEKIKGASHDA